MRLRDLVDKTVMVRLTTGSVAVRVKGKLKQYSQQQWSIQDDATFIVWPKHQKVSFDKHYHNVVGVPLFHLL